MFSFKASTKEGAEAAGAYAQALQIVDDWVAEERQIAIKWTEWTLWTWWT